jgi:SET domain-containing protein
MDDGSGRSREGLKIEKTNYGKAVFARREFKKGDFIIEFRGKKYTREEYIKKLNPRNNHFLQIDDNLYLGPTRTPDNYINHSCNPNAGMKFQNGRVFLYAIKPIKKGAEITFDYSTSMDEDYWEMDCQCGSRNCRRKVRDFKYLPEDTREKYIKLGIVPDFILKNLRS